MNYLIGTSGYMYDSWKGKFYPEDIKKEDWLEYFSKQFKTVEINNSFYNLPSKDTFRRWKKQSENNFVFSVKANRYITHMKKLSDPEESLKNFLENASALDDKLGPLLFQLPPFWHKNQDKLENFFRKLPKKHEVVFEFRHESWYDKEIYELLDKYNIALCLHDLADGSSPQDLVTTNFSYIRFHGPDGRYSTSYSEEQLQEWAERIRDLDVKKIYCYFNNDNSGYAIENARTLREKLNL